MKYYQLDDLNKLMKTNNKSKIAIIAISVLFVLYTALIIIFSKYEMKLLFKILLIVGDSLIICGLIFVITYFFIPSKKMIKHFESVMGKSPTFIEGKVEEISKKPLSLASSIRVYQIRVKTLENDTKVLYFLDIFEIEDDILNTNIRFETVNNFIKGYEKI